MDRFLVKKEIQLNYTLNRVSYNYKIPTLFSVDLFKKSLKLKGKLYDYIVVRSRITGDVIRVSSSAKDEIPLSPDGAEKFKDLIKMGFLGKT